MAKISVDPAAAPDRVLDTVRATFESRDYAWEPDGPLEATASEGGRDVGSTLVAQRLQVAVRVEPDRGRVVLRQRTVGAAYAANGSGWFTVKLTARFAAVRKQVRADLEAAGLRPA